jgi:hypothetical protein
LSLHVLYSGRMHTLPLLVLGPSTVLRAYLCNVSRAVQAHDAGVLLLLAAQL